MARAKKKKEVVDVVITTTESNEETVVQIEKQDEEVAQIPFVQTYDESVYSPIAISHVEEVNENPTEDETVAIYASTSLAEPIEEPKATVKATKINKYPVYGDFTYNWNGQCIEY